MLSRSAQKVQNALEALGFSYQVVELPRSTRTSASAAEAIGCQIGQIVKSLVFKGQRTGKPILVIASGPNRVHEKIVARLASEPIERADPDFVRQRTGFVIGGVPPTGHLEQMETFVDEDLLQYEDVWAAAGNPNAVVRLASADLLRMTRGRVASIKKTG